MIQMVINDTRTDEINEMLQLLKDKGWRCEESNSIGDEYTYFFLKNQILLSITYEPCPDVEVIEDIFGEDIAKEEFPDEE
jgi:hypothetical protein